MFSGSSGKGGCLTCQHLLFAKQTRKRYSIFLFMNDINLGPLCIRMGPKPSRDGSS